MITSLVQNRAADYMSTPADYRYFNRFHIINVATFKTLRNTHSLVYDLASSDYFIVREIASRLATLVLPVFYTLACISNLGAALVTKVLKNENFFELEHTQGGTYLQIGLFYLQQIVQSFVHIGNPQLKTVLIKKHLYESLPRKGLFVHTGYIERIGANLVGYFGSRWITYELQKRDPEIKHIYRRFDLSEKFRFSKSFFKVLTKPYCIPNFPYTPDTFRVFGKGQEIETLKDLQDFFATNDGVFEVLPRQDISYLRIKWDDPEFKELLRAEIQPIEDLELSLPPEGCYSIAMHVRTGGDFDHPDTKFEYPSKLPPFSYYEYGLQKALSKAFDQEQKIYVRIFTDDLTPCEIKRKIKSFVEQTYKEDLVNRIQIEICEDVETQKASVLNDMFSLVHYDALVRPQSGLSSLCRRLTDYDLEIYPTKHAESDERSSITEVTIATSQSKSKFRKECVEFSHIRRPNT